MPIYDVQNRLEEGPELNQISSDFDPVSDLGSGGILQMGGVYSIMS